MSTGELLFLGLLALLVFGPKKLPEIGRQVGRVMLEFKRASDQFKSQLTAEMSEMNVSKAEPAKPAELQAILPSPAAFPPSGEIAVPTGSMASLYQDAVPSPTMVTFHQSKPREEVQHPDAQYSTVAVVQHG